MVDDLHRLAEVVARLGVTGCRLDNMLEPSVIDAAGGHRGTHIYGSSDRAIDFADIKIGTVTIHLAGPRRRATPDELARLKHEDENITIWHKAGE